MTEQRESKDLTFDDVQFVYPFLDWYSSNIGRTVIWAIFPENKWKWGYTHHLVVKLEEECRWDKLRFWQSLDTENKKKIFEYFRDNYYYKFIKVKKREHDKVDNEEQKEGPSEKKTNTGTDE